MALVAPDGRFTEREPSAVRDGRLHEEELLARDFQSITHPDDLAASAEQHRALLTGAAREL